MSQTGFTEEQIEEIRRIVREEIEACREANRVSPSELKAIIKDGINRMFKLTASLRDTVQQGGDCSPE